jgi:membrane protein implicated in regulation of membrane protease activity
VCKEEWVNSAGFYWIFGGIFLSIMELFIPGIFVIFLGLGAIFTGALLLVTPLGLSTQILLWVFSSGSIILIASQFLKNFFPSDSSIAESSVEDEYIGKTVLTVKRVEVGNRGGRVQLQGTEWDAIALTHPIEVGEVAKIYDRDNLLLIIEKIEG